jgi:uncharacterized OB-fold protein
MTGSLVQSHLQGVLTFVDDQPHLVGSRCNLCATDTFPSQTSCPRCGSENVDTATLPSDGTIWTWTVQRNAPKAPFRAPHAFLPFAVAYVDLGTVRVEARLAGKAVESWRLGDAVRLVVGPLNGDEAGWQAFWFEPLKAGA